jgi:hypothetical protein
MIRLASAQDLAAIGDAKGDEKATRFYAGKEFQLDLLSREQ